MLRKIAAVVVIFMTIMPVGVTASSGEFGLFFGIGRTSSIRTNVPSEFGFEDGIGSSIRTSVPSDFDYEEGITSSIRTDEPSDEMTSSLRTAE